MLNILPTGVSLATLEILWVTREPWDTLVALAIMRYQVATDCHFQNLVNGHISQVTYPLSILLRILRLHFFEVGKIQVGV